MRRHTDTYIFLTFPVDRIQNNIREGEETPYYYKGDGTMEAFVRIGNETVTANAAELKRSVIRGRNSAYDSLI